MNKNLRENIKEFCEKNISYLYTARVWSDDHEVPDYYYDQINLRTNYIEIKLREITRHDFPAHIIISIPYNYDEIDIKDLLFDTQYNGHIESYTKTILTCVMCEESITIIDKFFETIKKPKRCWLCCTKY